LPSSNSQQPAGTGRRTLAGHHVISHRLEVLNHGGTDASLIRRLRAGFAVATLSVPARYIHTVNEPVSIGDADVAIALLARYLEDAHRRDYDAVGRT